MVPKRLRALPSRASDRTDIEDPMYAESSAEITLPRRAAPNTEIVEPKREKLRSEQEDPT
jgi:hypothetical protein